MHSAALLSKSGTGPPLIAIVGPTATGKTRYAVKLALSMGNAELINADSRQTLRGLTVGTCAPTEEELRGVPCHLLHVRDPGEDYSVANWLAAAQQCIEDMIRRDVQPIVVGGTGLYVTALVDGFDFGRVPPDPEQRARRHEVLDQPGGLERLVAELHHRDPSAPNTIDVHNPRRILRALETLDARSQPLVQSRGHSLRYEVSMFAIDVPREKHNAAIADRSRWMIESGALLEETKAARARGISREVLADSAIGCRECLALLDETMNAEQAIGAITQRTRQYAKRQRTWFRRDQRIQWIPTADVLDGAV